MLNVKYFALCVFLFIGFIKTSFAQIYPVSLSERIDNASRIVIAEVEGKISYWDAPRHNIYTLNILNVKSYLKGHLEDYQIGLISLGGLVGDQMEVSYPSIELNEGEEVLVLMGDNNFVIDNKALRSKEQGLLQCTSNYGVQGVLKYQKGKYHDKIAVAPLSEEELLKVVKNQTNETARKPNGDLYRARVYENNQPSLKSISGLSSDGATGFVAGTIVENNELIITGSGFGSSIGEVVFKDSNSGGTNDYIVPTQTIDSDIISWTDTEVRVKIPTRAGTGTVEIITSTGNNAGSASITIDYSVNNVTSDFYSWGADNRNRVELLNMDDNGGYIFKYNNNTPSAGASFHANIAAREAFERAIESWTCNTFVNFEVDDSGTSAPYANDNGSIVTFYNLSGGTLGITTLRYSAGANGGCTAANTLWYLKEMDIRFDYTIQTGFSWNYGPGSTSNNQFDFESVAVHELGHAHGLGHIIATGKVMHYSLTNGSEVRDLSEDDIAAGVYKVSHSTESNCISTPTPMIALTADNCGAAPLPIEWGDFTATEANGEVVLNWETYHEKDNQYFSIERSSDLNGYHEISRVTGAGNSTNMEAYRTIDPSPVMGINYYRIKQTDFDGSISYSKIEAVEIHGADLNLQIFPNPVTRGSVKIGLNSNEIYLTEVKIFDARGKLLVFDMNRDTDYFTVNTQNLPAGVYIVKAQTSSGMSIGKRFLKQ